MYHFFGTCQNTNGAALPGWFVEARSGGSVVPIYADQGGTLIESVSGVNNRAKVDANGNFDFWIPEGSYDLYYFNAAQVQQSRIDLSVNMAQIVADLASLDTDKGASLIGAVGETNVQLALGARIKAADLGSTSAGKGASLVGTTYEENAQLALDARAKSADLASTATGKGAGLVGFSHAATYAAGTLGSKAKQTVSVKDAPYNATGDGTTNDTAAIQAAIDTGFDLFFPSGTYLANNLTQSAFGQKFYADGRVVIKKNANGPLFTSSGSDVELKGLAFCGDAASPAFTGDGIVMNGNNARLINCGSRWMAGRALRATGNHVQIFGTCEIYQTTDTSATGYDIEIGVSGTSTLYHELHGVYTSQSTGGIRFVDTGSHTIVGGLFGKLYIARGTAPAGANGGKTVGARILGNVTVELSNAVFIANQFGAISVTLGTGTSGCTLNASNIYSVGATVTNNGNTNNLIERQISTGGAVTLSYGDDTFARSLTMNTTDLTKAWTFDGSVLIANGQAFRSIDVVGSGNVQIAQVSGANNNIALGASTAGFTNVIGGTGGLYIVAAGASIAQAYSGGVRPPTDNTLDLGTASQRWRTVYAGTATINTSDARQKQQVRELSDAERRVALRCKSLIRAFKFNDAVEAKGPDKARWHFGVIAQDVAAAFEAEGLDGFAYGLLCHDDWDNQEAVTEDVIDGDGKPTGEIRTIAPAIKADDRFGIRYEELLAFVVGAS